MTLNELRQLEIGDQVQWADPQSTAAPGMYHIQEIVTDTGMVEDEESILVITDGAGMVSEISASELH